MFGLDQLDFTLEELCREYIKIFSLANTYAGENMRRTYHEKIAFKLGLKDGIEDESLQAIVHYLEKPENINFPLKTFSEYEQMMDMDRKDLEAFIWEWGGKLFDFLKKKYKYEGE